MRRWFGLAGWIGLCFAAAGIGAAFTSSSVNGWYRTLDRPSWAPPNWIFGPVWTLLYLGMAVAAWRVWERRSGAMGKRALTWFGIQLALNVGWSAVFFGMRRPGLALIEIVILWLAIAATLWSFRQVDRVASGLLVPYLAWVTFASLLNLSIWRMNG